MRPCIASLSVLLSLMLSAVVSPPAFAQYTQQGAKLVATGALGSANQGWSAALSADGNTALVGGPGDNYSGSGGVGATWVYTRSHGVWTQQAKLTGAGYTDADNGFGPTGVGQGSAAALSADGNTAIVGGDLDNGGRTGGAGAVWIFTRSNGQWSQQGPKLTCSGLAGSNLGYSVAISADGNTAIAGAPGDYADTGAAAGSACVLARDSSGIWHQQGSPLAGSDASGFASQGRSVALSADGNTALVGGDWDNSAVGAAWVFTRSGGVWTQQGKKLIGTGGVNIPPPSGFGGPTGIHQGFSAALSADGNTAVIGGNRDNGGAGALWVFTRSNNTWTQQGQKLTGTGADGNAGMGHSVSISGDGNTAITGGPDENGGFGTGAAWVFRRTAGGVWSQQGAKLVGSGSISTFDGMSYEGPAEGFSVALSSDATTAMIGAWVDNQLSGAAWVFAVPHFTLTAPATAKGGTPFNFIVSVFDANNLLLPTYAGTVHFTSSDPAASLPADATLTSGTGNFAATLNTGGSQTITASDTADAAVTGTSSAVSVTAAVPAGPPAPVSVTPSGGNSSNAAFTFVFSDPGGYQNLKVVDILFNNFLDGRHACYLAYIAAQSTLILVDDAGDAGGPYAGNVPLGNSAAISNSQCSATLVSASGSGNNLTLGLSVTWTAAFAGDKIAYLSAGDIAGNNSGWQALGVYRAPGTASSITTAVVSLSPSRGTGLGPSQLTFTWSDSLGYQNLGVENVLINDSLDGRHACYLAFARPAGVLYLVNDNGDGLLPGQSLAASGSTGNSQCTVTWGANAVSSSGNSLVLALNIAFTASFGGNRIVYTAARDINEANNTDWHAMGTWTPQ